MKQNFLRRFFSKFLDRRVEEKKFEVNKFKYCATGAAGGAFTANIFGIGTQRGGENYQKVSLIKKLIKEQSSLSKTHGSQSSVRKR